MEKHIAVIDMKAFYAFVECVERGLNPFTTPLAVCDPTRGEGTVVMPQLKTFGELVELTPVRMTVEAEDVH